MKNLIRKFIDFTNDEERMDTFFDNLNKSTDSFFEVADKVVDKIFDKIDEVKLESDLSEIDKTTKKVTEASEKYLNLLQEKAEKGEPLDGEDVENAKKEMSDALGGFDGVFEDLKSDLG